jgi:hypothetical protein
MKGAVLIRYDAGFDIAAIHERAVGPERSRDGGDF